MMLYRHKMNGESDLSSGARCPHCGGSHAPEALVCPNTDAVLPLQGRLLAGKFRLLHELGAGGMGVVWRAHHELVHKDVAIKIMRREYVRDAKGLSYTPAQIICSNGAKQSLLQSMLALCGSGEGEKEVGGVERGEGAARVADGQHAPAPRTRACATRVCASCGRLCGGARSAEGAERNSQD